MAGLPASSSGQLHLWPAPSLLPTNSSLTLVHPCNVPYGGQLTSCPCVSSSNEMQSVSLSVPVPRSCSDARLHVLPDARLRFPTRFPDSFPDGKVFPFPSPFPIPGTVKPDPDAKFSVPMLPP